MPVCFQLTRKGESKPSNLNDIDHDICKMMGVPVDDREYCCEWFSYLGLAYAVGKTTEEMVGAYKNDPDLNKIAKYIHDNYTVYSWR